MLSETPSRLVSLPLRTWSGRLIDARIAWEYFLTPFEFFGYYLLVNFPFTFVYRNSENYEIQKMEKEVFEFF